MLAPGFYFCRDADGDVTIIESTGTLVMETGTEVPEIICEEFLQNRAFIGPIQFPPVYRFKTGAIKRHE